MNKSKPLSVIMMRAIWDDVAFGSLRMHAYQFFLCYFFRLLNGECARNQFISIAVVKLTTALTIITIIIVAFVLFLFSVHLLWYIGETILIFQLFWVLHCDLVDVCWSSCRFNLLVCGRSMCDIWNEAWPCDMYIVHLLHLWAAAHVVWLFFFYILISPFHWRFDRHREIATIVKLFNHLSLIYCL